MSKEIYVLDSEQLVDFVLLAEQELPHENQDNRDVVDFVAEQLDSVALALHCFELLMETVELVLAVLVELVAVVAAALELVEKRPKEQDFELAATVAVLVEFLEALRRSTGKARFLNSALVRLRLLIRRFPLEEGYFQELADYLLDFPWQRVISQRIQSE